MKTNHEIGESVLTENDQPWPSENIAIVWYVGGERFVKSFLESRKEQILWPEFGVYQAVYRYLANQKDGSLLENAYAISSGGIVENDVTDDMKVEISKRNNSRMVDVGCT